MSIFIQAFENRTVREEVSFRDASGTLVALAAQDKVRIKIGRSGSTPLLDIVSGSPLDGGSYVTRANPAFLELVGADLVASRIVPGLYDIEAGVVDSNDSNRFQLAEQGIFSLISTQSGGVS